MSYASHLKRLFDFSRFDVPQLNDARRSADGQRVGEVGEADGTWQAFRFQIVRNVASRRVGYVHLFKCKQNV